MDKEVNMAKIIWGVTLFGFFMFSGCSLIKTRDHGDVFRNFEQKFPKPTFKEPRENLENRI